MSRKNSKTVRKYVELSTRFANQYPEQLLDAEEFIVNQLTKTDYPPSPSAIGSPNIHQELSQEENGQLDTKYCQNSNISTSNDLRTPAHKLPLSLQQVEQFREREFPKFASRPLAAEITPLQSAGVRAKPDQMNPFGVLDTLSACLGLVDKASYANGNLNDFLNNARIQDITEAIRSYDDALSHVVREMNVLTSARQRLSNLMVPFETDWVLEAAKLVRDGDNVRNDFKRKNEMELLSDWLTLQVDGDK
eukprot:353681_1